MPGETILGSGFATHAGGKGANQAVAAARASASVTMVGRLGSDSGAAFLRAALFDDGINVDSVGTCKHDPTGTALITVADTGENTIVVVPGANALLRPVHVDDAVARGAFTHATVVMAQLEIPLDAVAAGFAAARAVGAHTILNAAPAQEIPAQLLELVDVLVVNETELRIVVGTTSTKPQDWANDLLRVGSIGTIVLTLGDQGVVFATRSSPDGGWVADSVPGHPVEVVDSTAAGDTFCGYLAAALADGQELGPACALANAAAAMACTKAGAQPSIPRLDEVRAFVSHR